jgi:hypothetical protein
MAGHVERIEMRCAHRILVEKPERKNPVGGLMDTRRILLKWI